MVGSLLLLGALLARLFPSTTSYGISGLLHGLLLSFLENTCGICLDVFVFISIHVD